MHNSDKSFVKQNLVTSFPVHLFLCTTLIPNERIPNERIPNERIPNERIPNERIPNERIPNERIPKSYFHSCTSLD